MTALMIGTALALAALSFVLYPLFRYSLDASAPPLRHPRPAPSVSAIDALREIEFDHATGKLSERDYAELKASYTQRALEMMRGVGDEGTTVVCGVCGPRPEPDATFCSECGRPLAA